MMILTLGKLMRTNYDDHSHCNKTWTLKKCLPSPLWHAPKASFFASSDKKLSSYGWKISISVAYLKCSPLSRFLVNRQQWERYITTQPNPSPRKTKGWQLSPGGPRYQAYQKPAEDVWEYSAQFGRGWKREIVRLGIIDVGQQPPTEPGRIHVQEAAEGYWER